MGNTKVVASSSSGIGFGGLLTVAFIVLKLVGVITWKWVWVLAPLWIGVGLTIAVAVVIFAIALIIGLIARVS